MNYIIPTTLKIKDKFMNNKKKRTLLWILYTLIILCIFGVLFCFARNPIFAQFFAKVENSGLVAEMWEIIFNFATSKP